MTPIDVGEIGGTDITVNTLWLRGGFPESVTATSERTSLAWRRDFLRSYVERDVPMFAPRLPTAAIERLWEMLAHGQGSLLNQARLASSLGVSSPAVARYIDLLVDLLLVRRRPLPAAGGAAAAPDDASQRDHQLPALRRGETAGGEARVTSPTERLTTAVCCAELLDTQDKTADL